MNKVLRLMLLTVLLGTQFSTSIINATLIASELTSEQDSEVMSDLASEQTSEVMSEQTSEVTDEQTSEVTSEQTSENATEVSSEVMSEQTSEEAVEVNDLSVDASLKIISDGAVNAQAQSTRTAEHATASLKADENLSAYENSLRTSANSGESTINITPTSKSSTSAKQITNQEVYYVMNDEGEIVSGSTKQPRSYNGNLLTVYNGKIVDADSAIARTSGGYDYSFYAYDSIEDLKSNTNGVPLSGGGFDATLIDTVEEDGVYYDHIKISGYEGYTVASNIQIVPEQLIKSRSYYTVEDKDWVYYSAIDPLTSTEYERMEIGAAPADAKSGVEYYSDDDVNYYEDQIISQGIDPLLSYNSYFMNLPFRSESNYSVSDYKSYLNSKGKNSSEYYNETSAFTDAQKLESVNSLMMFSMANHESAYGTSTYARACYNFFGRGAVDSDPDKACQQYNYKTATDGILAQTLFLQNTFFDVTDWRYSGTHVGNKASGMNVKYASDPDWGKKISNHAYMMDSYKGGKEEDKYAIVQVKGTSYVYTSGALSTKVKSSGDGVSYNSYDLSQMVGTNNSINVVATQKDSDAYRIYVPTSVKKYTSTDCSYTNSKRGSYPNYEGRSKRSVATNTANYSCDYVSFSSEQYWISRSNTTVLNDKSIPNALEYRYQYYPDGTVKYKFIVDPSNNVLKYAYGYDSHGNLNRMFKYQSNTVYGKNHGSKVTYKYYISNGYVKSADKFDSQGRVSNKYLYRSDATLSNYSKKLHQRYDLYVGSGAIKQQLGYNTNNQVDSVYVYPSGTTFENRSGKVRYKYYLKPGTSYIDRTYRYNSARDVDKVYNYTTNTVYGSHSNRLKEEFFLKGSDMEINYAYGYGSNNRKHIKYTYDSGTKYGENHGQHVKSKYYYY